jgi:hypothetical protein
MIITDLFDIDIHIFTVEAKIDQLCNTAGEIKKPLIYIGIFK